MFLLLVPLPVLSDEAVISSPNIWWKKMKKNTRWRAASGHAIVLSRKQWKQRVYSSCNLINDGYSTVIMTILLIASTCFLTYLTWGLLQSYFFEFFHRFIDSLCIISSYSTCICILASDRQVQRCEFTEKRTLFPWTVSVTLVKSLIVLG